MDRGRRFFEWRLCRRGQEGWVKSPRLPEGFLSEVQSEVQMCPLVDTETKR